MNGPYRIFVWCVALLGATLPFGTLHFFLPPPVLQSGGDVKYILFNIPNKLVSEFAFIGVAIFITCIPDWLTDNDFRTFRIPRKRFLICFRALCFLCSGVSFFYYIRISLIVNDVYKPEFGMTVQSDKFALFWCVIGSVAASAAAVVFHLGQPGATNP